MARYYASCGYEIKFLLAVELRTLLSNNDFPYPWEDDYEYEGYMEMCFDWLGGEACDQAETVLENVATVDGDDPDGVTIFEEGMSFSSSPFWDMDVEDLREMFEPDQPTQLRPSYQLEIKTEAHSSAEICLHADRDPERLFNAADRRAEEVAILLENMIHKGSLPQGWTQPSGFEVKVSSVSVYKEHGWFTRMNEKDYRPTLIQRPVKQANYRRK